MFSNSTYSTCNRWRRVHVSAAHLARTCARAAAALSARALSAAAKPYGGGGDAANAPCAADWRHGASEYAEGHMWSKRASVPPRASLLRRAVLQRCRFG